jgi:hypothetical protein
MLPALLTELVGAITWSIEPLGMPISRLTALPTLAG